MEKTNLLVLKGELKIDEGTKLKAYKDTEGNWSIGTGRNLDARRGGALGISVMETEALKITRASCLAKGITTAQSDALLDNDIAAALHDLDVFLPWWRKLDDVRQRVLANMCFNLGIKKLLGFTDTLRCAQQGRYNEAAAHMLDSLWAGQVHDRADRLANLMRLGVKH